MKIFYTLVTALCVVAFTLLFAQKNNRYFQLFSFSPAEKDLPVKKAKKSNVLQKTRNTIKKDELISFYSPANLFTRVDAITAVGITATKTVDKTTAVPGDVLNYTITISNGSGTSATNVVLTDIFDANTTLVPNSLTTSPIAGDDAYSSLGNVGINVPAANGILINDNLGTPTPAVFVAVTNAATIQGGTINIAADGGFTYVPAPSFTGTDTYVYTLSSSGGSSTGTITFTISGMVWFIDNSYTGTTADGRLNTPFKTLAAFNTVNVGGTGKPKAGENIFIYAGSGSYTGGLTLLNTQKLIGQGSSLSLTSITGLSAPTYSYPLPSTSGTSPTLINTGGYAITVAQSNIIRGLNLGTSTSTTLSGVTGSAIGTFQLNDASIYATGQAINLTSGTSFTSTLSSVTSLGGTNNIVLSNFSTASSLVINAGTLSGASGISFNVTAVLNSTISFAGSITNTTNGITLINNTGSTISFTGGLNLNTGGNNAFAATGGGTLNITQNNSTIVNTLATTTGIALNVASGTQIGANGLTFRSISVNGAAAKGVILNSTGSTGGFIVTGNGSTGTGGTINNVTGRGMDLNSVKSVSLTYMNFTQSSNQSNGGTISTCGQNDITGCNAALYLQSITGGTTLANLNITGGWQQGINGTALTNLNINTCTLTSNGNEAEEGAIKLRDITGISCSITNSNITLSGSKMAHIINTTGTMRLAVTNSTFSNNLISTFGESAFELRAQGSANNTVVISGSTFSKANTKGIQMFSEGASSIINASVKNCTVDRVAGDMAGVEVGSDQTGVMNVNVDNNTLITAKNEVALNLYSATSSTFQGTAISNTSIKGSNDNSTFATVRAVAINNATSKVKIDGNTITETDQQAVLVQSFSATTAGRIDATVSNNTINTPIPPAALPTEGIEVRVGSGAAAPNTICSNVASNNVTVNYSSSRAFRARTTASGNVLTLQYNAAVPADIVQYWNNNLNSLTNTGGNPTPIIDNVAVGSTFTYSSAACLLPGNINAVLRTIPVDNNIIKPKTSSIDSPLDIVTNSATSTTEEVPTPTLENNILPVSQERFTVSAARTTSGETVTTSAFTLPAGKTVTIKFQATVNNPFPTNTCSVSNQGTVTGTLSASSFSVLTDNPSLGGATDPTVTQINTAPVITTCQTNIVTNTDGTSCTASKTFGVSYSGCPAGTVTYTLNGTATTITSPYNFPVGTTTVDVSVSNGIGSAATCSFTVTVNAGTWLGTTSTDWNNAANWCGGVIPTSTTDVLIPTGAVRMPVLTAASVARNITLQTSTTLTLNGQSLTANGNITGSGIIIGSTTSSLILSGTGASTLNFNQTTDGTTNALANLTLSGSGSTNTLSNKLNLYNTLTLTAGNLSTSNLLVLKSSASSTAKIAVVTSGTITGNVTVERYISSNNNRAYRLLAPSVTTATSIHANWQENATSRTDNPKPTFGTHITGNKTDQTNGFDGTLTGQGSLFTYNQATDNYVAVPNTTTNLDAKVGMLMYIRGDRSIDLNSTASPLPTSNTTLRATGTVLIGTQTFPNLVSNGGFSLVTNPYPSAINWSTIYNNNTASFENYYTYVDPNINDRGGYVTVRNDGIANMIIPTNQGINIQSGLAYFVKTKTGVSTPTLTILESDKSSTNNVDVFRTTAAAQQFTVSLYFNSTTQGRRIADGVTALYDKTYNAAIDGNDAIEINNFDENIAIARAGKHLSIEERVTINSRDTLPLFMNNMKQQAYEFEFNPTGFNPSMVAQLVDKFTGSSTVLNISSSTIVPFSVTANAASAATDRFYVLFSPAVALPVTISSVKAYKKSTGVQVEWIIQQENNMDRYEVERSANGQSFIKVGSVASRGNSNIIVNYNYFDAVPLQGLNFYRIKSVDKNGKLTYSEVVKVNISSAAKNAVTISPNPVTGSSVAVQINLPKGSYTFVLTNKLGQQLSNKVVQHLGGITTETLEPSADFAAGVYQLKVKGNGINITEQVIKK